MKPRGDFMADILGVVIIRWIRIIAAVTATILIAYIISWALSEFLKKRSFHVDNRKHIVRIAK